MKTPVGRFAAVSAAYFIVTLVWAWPLPLHLASRFAHDPGDPLLVTYLMWWNAHAIPLTPTWWNPPFFWPLRDALTVTEHLLGLSPISTPVQLLGGSPLLAYNLILIASAWWSGLATHVLVHRLTKSTAAAACAGLAFAFAPYRTSQLAHLQLYASWWLPVALLAVHAYVESGRRRWLFVFGISWLLQALTNGYMLLFFPVLLLAWVAWFVPWRTHPRRGLAIAVTWLLFSLPLIPVLLKYYEVQTSLGMQRDRPEMIYYSAQWSSFLSASWLLRFWQTRTPATTEVFLFPGATVLALIVLAAGARLRDRAFVFYVGAAIVTAWFCFGPSREAFSIASLWHPYDWIVWLPGFSGLRVPSRFFLLTSLCLAIAAGLAVAHLRTRVRHPTLLACLVFAGLIVDGAISGMPIGAPPGSLNVSEPGARVIALPFDDPLLAIRTMYQSMQHRLPVVNGYGGYVPWHAAVIQWALRRNDPSILTELRRGHPLYVIVGSSDEAPVWTRFMDAQHEATMIGVSGGGRVYRMAPAAFPRQITRGPAISPASVQVSGTWLVADLGTVRPARLVEVRTSGYLARLPAMLAVEASDDGVTWTMVSEQPPGGPALLGTLESPQTIPVRVLLPDVQARFVRINASAFGSRALTIYGP